MRLKKTSFVPRAVKGAGFATTIPACVLLGLGACSNGSTNPPLGVAGVAYCCFEAGGVADAAFARPDGDGSSDAREESADAPSDGPHDGSEGG